MVFSCVIPKTSPKMSCSNRPPTLTYGSSRATSCLLPCCNELPEHFSCSHDLFLYLCFLLQNSLYCLCSNVGLQLLCILLHYLLYYGLCSCKFLCYPERFLLQRLNILCEPIVLLLFGLCLSTTSYYQRLQPYFFLVAECSSSL
jgi:hypothetical protein